MSRPRTIKQAKKRAWNAISRYIRASYATGFGDAMCVTCKTVKPWTELHCGHYQHGLTYGVKDGEVFVWEENLHPQCPKCNTFQHGALDSYTLYMIEVYGREMVEELRDAKAAGQKGLKIYVDDLWRIEQEYKEKFDALGI